MARVFLDRGVNENERSCNSGMPKASIIDLDAVAEDLPCRPSIYIAINENHGDKTRELTGNGRAKAVLIFMSGSRWFAPKPVVE